MSIGGLHVFYLQRENRERVAKARKWYPSRSIRHSTIVSEAILSVDAGVTTKTPATWVALSKMETGVVVWDRAS